MLLFLSSGVIILNNKKTRGFTLIELMFVVSLVTILMIFAVPNYLRFKQRQAVRNAAATIAADMKVASAEALRSESKVWVCFYSDPGSNSIYYRVIRDLNNDESLTDYDGGQGGLLMTRKISDDFMGSRMWGDGVANGNFLTFGKAGGVVEGDTNLSRQTAAGTDPKLGRNVNYYSIMVSKAQGTEIEGQTFEIRITEDGKVQLVQK